MNLDAAALDKGDPVGWHATPRHGAGSGMIVDVLRSGPTLRFVVQKLIDAAPIGDPFEVDETIVFPIRSLRDTRPQPAPHRREF